MLGFDYPIVLITPIVGATSCRDRTVLIDILKKAISRLEAAPTIDAIKSHIIRLFNSFDYTLFSQRQENPIRIAAIKHHWNKSRSQTNGM
jgi:hypothetical protein